MVHNRITQVSPSEIEPRTAVASAPNRRTRRGVAGAATAVGVAAAVALTGCSSSERAPEPQVVVDSFGATMDSDTQGATVDPGVGEAVVYLVNCDEGEIHGSITNPDDGAPTAQISMGCLADGGAELGDGFRIDVLGSGNELSPGLYDLAIVTGMAPSEYTNNEPPIPNWDTDSSNSSAIVYARGQFVDPTIAINPKADNPPGIIQASPPLVLEWINSPDAFADVTTRQN